MIPFLRKLTWLTKRSGKEADLRDELQFHLDEEAEERLAEGLAADQARWAARRGLGNIASIQEDTRAAWGWITLEQTAQDVRYAFRTMAKAKVFTALAVLSLALGIGANTAMYSFMDSILLRSLPVSDPESLAVLNWHAQGTRRLLVMHSEDGSDYRDQSGITSGIFPFPAFELFQKNASDFVSLFAYHRAGFLTLTARGKADSASGEYVSGDYFRGLAIRPAAGRLITPDDDLPGAPPAAVVSYAYSQRRFGGAASAPGQSILINNVAFTIAGVTPPEFYGVDPAAAPDVYLPIYTKVSVEAADQFGFRAGDYLDANYYWVEIMGRLRPGAGRAQAQARLAPQFHQWVAATATTDPERAHLPALVVKEGAGGLDSLRRRYSQPMFVLLALVGLILALACANVASLLLARATARKREMALRLSVGAGRLRLVRQLLTESVLLALSGGILGVLFAIWGIRFLTLLLANGQTSFTLHAQLNWHVLAAAAALCLLTGVLFGLAPALQSTRVDVMPALKETRAGQSGARRGFRRATLSDVLVAVQIAISLLMLVAAGLFVRTLSNLQSVELGFNRENTLLFELNARHAGHMVPEICAFYGDLRNRLSQIPGVRNVSLSNRDLVRAGFSITMSLPGAEPLPRYRLLAVGPAFFTTMGIPILAGREILETDRPGSPAVVVIDEQFAKTYFAGRNPLGQHLTVWRRKEVARDMQVVGVARNVRYGGLKGDVPPIAYITYDQGYPEPDRMVFELRTAGDPLAYVSSVREIVRQADSRVPVTNVKTQAADIDETINQEIVFARLCTGFALLGLTIVCVGIYGTVAYNVARRTGEIGIRMALGAQRGAVVRMILRDVLKVAAAGLAISVPAALVTSRLVESFLFGMKPNDPIALSLATAILMTAAFLAGYAPARKASRIDPMVAVRHE